MPGKGFLIRGTLSPQMGATTGRERGLNYSSPPARKIVKVPVNNGKITQGPAKVQNNRIPSSISIRKNAGVR